MSAPLPPLPGSLPLPLPLGDDSAITFPAPSAATAVDTAVTIYTASSSDASALDAAMTLDIALTSYVASSGDAPAWQWFTAI